MNFHDHRFLVSIDPFNEEIILKQQIALLQNKLSAILIRQFISNGFKKEKSYLAGLSAAGITKNPAYFRFL